MTTTDPEFSESHLDSREFKAYCRVVASVIKHRMMLGDIKRALGDAYRVEWIKDALDALVADGQIIEPFTYRMEYSPATAQPKKLAVIKMDLSLPPQDLTRPGEGSYPARSNGGWR